MAFYRDAFEAFDAACRFRSGPKMIACLKLALKQGGVISSDIVARGTPTLEAREGDAFIDAYRKAGEKAALVADPLWQSGK
jgi:hypothetical protein